MTSGNKLLQTWAAQNLFKFEKSDIHYLTTIVWIPSLNACRQGR